MIIYQVCKLEFETVGSISCNTKNWYCEERMFKVAGITLVRLFEEGKVSPGQSLIHDAPKYGNDDDYAGQIGYCCL